MKTKQKHIKLRSSTLALVAFIMLGMIVARESAGLSVVPAVPAPTAKLTATMKLNISCTCPDYNHLGNEWSQGFSIDGVTVKGGETITLETGQTIILYTEIVEYDDAKDDIASDSFSVWITAENLENGFFIERPLKVKENGGRYKGNIAEWTVRYTFIP